MKKLMFLTIVFGLMIAFTAVVSAQEKATEAGTGRVMLIYGASELSPMPDDVVITRTKTGNGDHGEKKGIQYNELELKQGNKAMYISYSIKIGAIKDEINNKDVTVTAAGGSGVRLWKTEDKVSIRTKPASGGGTEVTFTGVSYNFTFIVKSTPKSIGMELVKIPSGSISAQDCVGKRPKVGDKFIVKPNGETSLYSRNTDPYGPWYVVCVLIVDNYYKQRAPKETYYATVNTDHQNSPGLEKGYIVRRIPQKTADFYRFYSADGKTEILSVIAMLDRPDLVDRPDPK